MLDGKAHVFLARLRSRHAAIAERMPSSWRPGVRYQALSSRTLAPHSDTPIKRHSFLRRGTSVLATFAVTRVLICAIVWIAMTALPIHVVPTMSTHSSNQIVEGLVRWDGFIYARIAEHGYDHTTTVFFPVYPLLVKGFTLFTGNVYSAGVLLSNLVFLAALGFMYALALHEFGEAAARRAILYLSVAPGSVFFSAMYTESVFVALVAATLYYARAKKWLWAGLAGAVAAATRNTGICLALAIVVEGAQQVEALTVSGIRAYLCRQGQRILAARQSLQAAALVGGGLALYAGYLAHTVGDPLAFVHMEARWGKHLSLSNLMHLLPPGSLGIADLISAGTALLFLLLLIAVARTMRPSYTVFAVVTFLLPLDTGGTSGMTRYALMLAPCYLVLGKWGQNRWINRAILGLSLPLMVFVAITFSHWGNIE